VRHAGKACLTAKGSRIPADWARHSGLVHFALQAGPSCTVGGSAELMLEDGASCRKGLPDRKGIPHPADWARHPWLAHFAFQAGHSCPVGIGAGFYWFAGMVWKPGASCRKSLP